MTFTIGTKNIAKENKRPGVDVKAMTDQADVIVWQEVETLVGKRALLATRSKGWQVFMPKGAAGAVPISWKRSKFELLFTVPPLLIADGKKGQYPNEYLNSVILVERATGRIFPIQNTHMLPQAFTSHPERKPAWTLSAKRLEKRVAAQRQRWHRVLGGGDVNRDKWAPANTTGHWALVGTHGRQKYDVIWSADVATQGVAKRVLLGNSDHDGLILEVH
jgi:hypothetical protein